MNKKIGFIGLGRMGRKMVENLLEKGWEVVGYNRTGKVTQDLRFKIYDLPRRQADLRIKKKFIDTYSLEDLVNGLQRPRVILIMVKAGRAVDEMIEGLLPHLSRGDILIDGGNDYYESSRFRMW